MLTPEQKQRIEEEAINYLLQHRSIHSSITEIEKEAYINGRIRERELANTELQVVNKYLELSRNSNDLLRAKLQAKDKLIEQLTNEANFHHEDTVNLRKAINENDERIKELEWVRVDERMPDLLEDGESDLVLCAGWKGTHLDQEPQFEIMRWRKLDKIDLTDSKGKPVEYGWSKRWWDTNPDLYAIYLWRPLPIDLKCLQNQI